MTDDHAICLDCGLPIHPPESGPRHGLYTAARCVQLLRAELATSESERMEQARLLGMSAERELALRAEVERLTRELAEAQSGTVKDSLKVAPPGEEEA